MVTKLVNLGDCHDDTDYLNSLDDLKDFDINNIVSIKIDNIVNCFPKSSIVEALVKGSIIFASPSIRYKISSVIGDEYLDLAGQALTNDDINNLSENIVNDNNDFGLSQEVFESIKHILEFYRFYKWPLTSNMVISSVSFDKFLNSTHQRFKLEKVGVLTDVSSFTAHGIGAIHGNKDLYDIIPENNKIIKSRKFVKYGKYQGFYSSPIEYKKFKDTIITNHLNKLKY